MNILYDNLPNSYNGSPFPTDFRTWIKFEQILTSEIDIKDKIAELLILIFPDFQGDIREALDYLLWFYRGGKDIKASNSSNANQNNVFSYDFDSEYIYAAFTDQYGIDLESTPNLHWWKFKAMFKSLKEDNEIVKIMGYRAMKISPSMTKEQKEFYQNMKEAYKLPLSQEEKQQIDEITMALMGNGDLSGVI